MRPAWRSRTITAVALFLESCTLYLIFAVVSHMAKVEQLQMPFWLVMVSMVWAFGLSTRILALRVSPVLRGLAGMALGVPSLLVLIAWNAGEAVSPIGLLVPAEAGGIGLFVGSVIYLLLTWWRGVEVSREEATLDSVRSAFQIGMITLLVVALIDAATEGRIVSGFLVIGFFAVGLPGMALARFSADGGEQREMPSQWVWPIGACVAGVLGLGLLVSGLGLGGLDDVSRVVARAIGSVGLKILEPVIMLIGLLAGALVSVGNWFAGMFGGGDLDGFMEAQRRINEFHESLRAVEHDPGGNIFFTVLRWTAAAFGTLAAVGIVYWLFRIRRHRSPQGEVVETRESLFSLRRAGDDAAGVISGILPGFRNARRRRLRSFLSPRDYYHDLLEKAGRAGRPKDAWETPREHQRGLSGILPADPVGRIVDEFQASHYGAGPSSPEQLGRLEDDRLALEQFLRGQESERQTGATTGRQAGPHLQ